MGKLRYKRAGTAKNGKGKYVLYIGGKRWNKKAMTKRAICTKRRGRPCTGRQYKKRTKSKGVTKKGTKGTGNTRRRKALEGSSALDAVLGPVFGPPRLIGPLPRPARPYPPPRDYLQTPFLPM
jgi:hypothetical protein